MYIWLQKPQNAFDGPPQHESKVRDQIIEMVEYKIMPTYKTPLQRLPLIKLNLLKPTKRGQLRWHMKRTTENWANVETEFASAD